MVLYCFWSTVCVRLRLRDSPPKYCLQSSAVLLVCDVVDFSLVCLTKEAWGGWAWEGCKNDVTYLFRNNFPSSKHIPLKNIARKGVQMTLINSTSHVLVNNTVIKNHCTTKSPCIKLSRLESWKSSPAFQPIPYWCFPAEHREGSSQLERTCSLWALASKHLALPGSWWGWLVSGWLCLGDGLGEVLEPL